VVGLPIQLNDQFLAGEERNFLAVIGGVQVDLLGGTDLYVAGGISGAATGKIQ